MTTKDHKDQIRGFIIAALLATRLCEDRIVRAARLGVLEELDAAFGLDLRVSKLLIAELEKTYGALATAEIQNNL